MVKGNPQTIDCCSQQTDIGAHEDDPDGADNIPRNQ